MNCIVLKLLFSYSGSQFKLFNQPLKKLHSSEQVYKLLSYNIKTTENKTPKKHGRILVTMAIKISRFINHLSGLQSKQHEVQLLNNYLIHALIKQRNKTANGSTQSCIFYPSSKHQTLQWCCSTPQRSPGVGRNTFLSSPHLCFIIVFICDLFVLRDDPLMSLKTSTRTEQLYVLSHDRSWGWGWVPVKPVYAPQYFCAGRSKAVLLLWFLTVTCSWCLYLYFGSAIILVTYFVNFR